MIITLQKIGTEGTYFNIIKAIHDKYTAYIILNDEKLKVFSLRLGITQGYPLSQLLFNKVLEVLATATREEKETKGIQIGKEVKLRLLPDNMLPYIENPKDAIRKLLDPITEFGKVARYKINAQTFLVFLYTNNKGAEREIKEIIPFTMPTKRITYLGISLPNRLPRWLSGKESEC